jgi:hypothetical protein
MEQETLPVALYQRNNSLVGGRSFGGNMRVGSVVIDDILGRIGIVVTRDIDVSEVIWSDGNSHWAWNDNLEVICK